MDKLKYIKLKNEDGSYTDSIPLAVDSDHVDVNGSTLTTKLGTLATKTEVQAVASGSPAGVYSTVTALTTTDPDHSKIYVVTEDGHWYYYNNGWQDGGLYQSTENNEKISSLLDIDLEWTTGYYLNQEGTPVALAGWSYSNYIKTMNGGISFPILVHTRTINNAPVAGYDENYHFLGYAKLTDSSNLTTVSMEIKNSNFAYIRFSKYNYNSAYACYTDISNLYIKYLTGDNIEYKTINKNHIDFIETHPKANLIDKNVLSSGYINKDGVVKPDNYLYCTDYINVKENVNYYYNTIINQYYAFYDEHKSFISGQTAGGNLPNPFTIPENAAFIRLTIHQTGLDTSWLYTDESGPKMNYDAIFSNDIDIFGKYCDYTKNDNIITFNKILCIGDSLTAGTFNYKQDGSIAHYIVYSKYSYPTYLNKLTNCEVTNKGDGGASIQSYWSRHQNENWSGHDLAIIELGTNNQTWGNEQITALTNIINKIKEENNNIFIFVSSTLPAVSYSQEWYNEINAGIEELVKNLNDSHVIFINLKKLGHTKDSLAYNCGHLSAYGYYRLAKDYANFISYYMDQNPLLFREVQFIGTDYHYV